LNQFCVSREGREENRRGKYFPFATFAPFARNNAIAGFRFSVGASSPAFIPLRRGKRRLATAAYF
jgi:hypothetical protein